MRLLRLVNTLLDFSRLEAGARRGALRAHRPRRATPPSWPACSDSADERAGLTLEVDCAAARPSRLRRPRHVGEDRPQPAVERVQVHLRRRRSRCAVRPGRRRRPCCAVTDTGTGIPADELPQLFERFHRVRGARGAQPRGLRHRARAGAPSSRRCTAARSSVTSRVGRGQDLHGAHPARRATTCPPSRSSSAVAPTPVAVAPAGAGVSSPRRSAGSSGEARACAGARAGRRRRRRAARAGRRRQRRHARATSAGLLDGSYRSSTARRRRRGARAASAPSRPTSSSPT